MPERKRSRLVKQAITTTYLGPTNTLGTRIKAKAAGGASTVVPRRYDLEVYQDHLRAARALMKKMGWTGRLTGASLNADQYVFVMN